MGWLGGYGWYLCVRVVFGFIMGEIGCLYFGSWLWGWWDCCIDGCMWFLSNCDGFCFYCFGVCLYLGLWCWSDGGFLVLWYVCVWCFWRLCVRLCGGLLCVLLCCGILGVMQCFFGGGLSFVIRWCVLVIDYCWYVVLGFGVRRFGNLC